MKKKKIESYTENDVENALKWLEQGNGSYRAAGKKFGIPKSTLIRRHKNGNQGVHGSGGTTILSKETEQLLVHFLKCFRHQVGWNVNSFCNG